MALAGDGCASSDLASGIFRVFASIYVLATEGTSTPVVQSGVRECLRGTPAVGETHRTLLYLR